MNKSQRPQQSFIKGATILAVAGLICKFIGAAYRIPLANILGADGMAYYQIAYPIYNFLLVVSSIGLPTAISRLVAGQVAEGSAGGAKRIFKVSFWLLLLIGVVTTSALLLASDVLSNMWLGNSQGRWALMAIAPSLLLVSLMSAYRGYFQGQQRMTPTAVSQIIEQVGKLFVGFFLADYFMKYGVQYAAAGALIGVTISEGFALLCIIAVYLFKGRPHVAAPSTEEERNRRRWEELPAVKESRRPPTRTQRAQRGKDMRRGGGAEADYQPGSLFQARFGTIAGKILAIAIPVTIGASIMPLVNMVDSAMVINRLKAGGLDPSIAKSLFGLLSGYVQPLINMPAVLTSALAMSLVPAISSAIAAKRDNDVHKSAQQGIRVTWLIGLPAVVGLMMLSGPIMNLLYPGLKSQYILMNTGTGASGTGQVISYMMRILSPGTKVPAIVAVGEPVSMLSIAGGLLTTMSVAVLFLSLVQTSTGVLQGLGLPFIPVFALLIGAVIKVGVNYMLVGMPGINIQGAPVGSILCYVVASVINMIYITKARGIKTGMLKAAMPLVIPTLSMGIVIFLENRFLLGASPSRTITIAAILSAVVVYGVMLILMGAISPQDLSRLPGGRHLARIVSKIRGGRG